MADRTSSSIVAAAARGAVMGVIADFGAYPDWATGVRSAEVLEDGLFAERTVFALKADSQLLQVLWSEARPVAVITFANGPQVRTRDEDQAH